MSGIGRPFNPNMQKQNININMPGIGMTPINPNTQINPMFGMNAMNAQQQTMMNQMFQSKNIKSQYIINIVPGMNMNINPMFNPMMNPLTNPANLMNMMKQPPPMQGEYKKVWVGHIPPGTSDAFILRLLETCGTVSSWKRTTDQQDKPKGFGLCEYLTVESMLKCLRLLNYLKLEEGYELSVSL
jgi:hypothetical protein